MFTKYSPSARTRLWRSALMTGSLPGALALTVPDGAVAQTSTPADAASAATVATSPPEPSSTTATPTAAPAGLAPAQPVPSFMAECPANRFCVWSDRDWVGHFAPFATGSADLTAPINGYVFHDQISSVWNRTSRSWCMYRDLGYRPNTPFVQSAGGYRQDLRVDRFNDVTSS